MTVTRNILQQSTPGQSHGMPTGHHGAGTQGTCSSWQGGLRELRELPSRLAAAKRWDELEALLTDLSFLEAKVAAGLARELPEVFRRAVAALPAERPMRRLLKLLRKAIYRDIKFIARHAEDYPPGSFPMRVEPWLVARLP